MSTTELFWEAIWFWAPIATFAALVLALAIMRSSGAFTRSAPAIATLALVMVISVMPTGRGALADFLVFVIPVAGGATAYWLGGRSMLWASFAAIVICAIAGMRAAVWDGPKENPPALIAWIVTVLLGVVSGAMLVILIVSLELLFRRRRTPAAP